MNNVHRLDVLSPRGQRSLADEASAAAIFRRNRPDFDYVGTPKDRPSDVDAVLVREGTIRAVVEQKSRYNCTLKTLFEVWRGEWLVTADKLDRARAVALAFRVPLYGFLYLVDERALLVRRLTVSSGDWVVAIRRERTLTQRTINGGEAMRLNAYVDMRDARVWR